MTTLAYLRQARLEIAPPGILVAELRMAFDIRLSLTSDPSPSTITVTNLSESRAAQIRKGAAVRLSAGYAGSPLDSLYEGETQRVEHERADLDRETRLLLGGVQQSRRTAAIFSRSYAGGIALRAVVRDIAGAMGLPTGPLDAIPDVVLEDYVTVDKAEHALTGLLRPRGVEWFVAGGELRFARKGRAERGVVLVISEATGLIGSPSRTDQIGSSQQPGARAMVRLNPLLQLNQRVRIQSLLLTGDYRIVTLTHRGDTWDGQWVTEIEANAL